MSSHDEMAMITYISIVEHSGPGFVDLLTCLNCNDNAIVEPPCHYPSWRVLVDVINQVHSLRFNLQS